MLNVHRPLVKTIPIPSQGKIRKCHRAKLPIRATLWTGRKIVCGGIGGAAASICTGLTTPQLKNDQQEYQTTLLKWAVASLAVVAGSAGAQTYDGDALKKLTWDQIVDTARGGTVNLFMWGGADNINRYVSETIGDRLKAEYGITLNRVALTDTVEAVNIVLGEKEAGVTDKGAVDLIWINGENFRTMKEAGLAYCGYTDLLPNNGLVNWDNPAIANDFGVPVDGCEVPWSKAQFAFAHDSARTPLPPMSIPWRGGATPFWARLTKTRSMPSPPRPGPP